MAAPAAVTVVVATRNRCAELRETVARHLALDEAPVVVVVDNDSTDATVATLAGLGAPRLAVVPLPANVGAAARTVGARWAATPLVAFSDDDSWWAPGALARAEALFARDPRLAVVAARVLVEPGGRLDPTCAAMAGSPLAERADLAPGCREVLGWLACGAVVRRDAFCAVGGFRTETGIGGEEELVALDLAAAGWGQVYAPHVVAHHRPSPLRSPRGRRRRLARNALWTAWARRPVPDAARRTLAVLRAGVADPWTLLGAADALRGAGWAVRHRAVVPPAVVASLRALEAAG